MSSDVCTVLQHSLGKVNRDGSVEGSRIAGVGGGGRQQGGGHGLGALHNCHSWLGSVGARRQGVAAGSVAGTGAGGVNDDGARELWRWGQRRMGRALVRTRYRQRPRKSPRVQLEVRFPPFRSSACMHACMHLP